MADSRESGIPFGTYRLVKRLARGGMAEVFLARQRGPEGFERRVALKRILPHLVDTPDFVQMFLDEARLAARLTHPHIVHIYEFGKVDEYFFIAMEFVDGVDLGRLITEAARAPIPPEIVARLGADAAAGLHSAHQLADADGRPLGIVHRDVSPQNLLVSYDGVVKIVDFGIAKAAYQAERTRPGVVKGKFAYMSPEQVVGKTLDGRSDVFSLAIVLWELLAGRVAVRRDDPAEAMRLIRDGKLPPIESVRPDIPAALAKALRHALAQDPKRRSTAAQFGTELESFLKQSSRLATPLVVAEWLRERFPREPSGLEPAQETAAATLGGTAQGTLETAAPGLSASPAGGMAEIAFPTAATTPVGDRGIARPVNDAESDRQAAHPLPVQRAVLLQRGRQRKLLLSLAGLGALGLVALVAMVFGQKDASRNPAVGAGSSGAVVEPGPEVVEEAKIEEVPSSVAPVTLGEVRDAAPEPLSTSAAIEIITDPPGATVELDDEPLPMQTPMRLQEIPPGTHRIRVSLAGYKPITRSVDVGAGENRTLEIALAPTPAAATRPKPPARARGRPTASTGWLSVRTIPWSEVYLGSRKLGTSPLADVEVPAGTHQLVFRNPDLGVFRRSVTIRPGATTKISQRLDRR